MNIEIDKLTPCLEETKTKKIVDTFFSPINRTELKSLKKWKFKWSSLDLNECEIFKLTVKGGNIMSEIEFKNICILDDIAEQAGGFVDSSCDTESKIHYDYRAIIAYCRSHNIEPIDMTIREMQQFVIL